MTKAFAELQAHMADACQNKPAPGAALRKPAPGACLAKPPPGRFALPKAAPRAGYKRAPGAALPPAPRATRLDAIMARPTNTCSPVHDRAAALAFLAKQKLDRVPLGRSEIMGMRPLSGPSAAQYFRDKARAAKEATVAGLPDGRAPQ